MLYKEIIDVCSQIHTKHIYTAVWAERRIQIHTKHINTLCGQNVELLNVKLAVHIVTTGF